MNRRLFPLLVVLAGALPARGSWIGDPTQSVESGAVVAGYQAASLDVENTVSPGSPAVEFKMRGLVLEQRSALNPVVQLSLRAVPFTGRMNLEGSTFNPHVAGGGAGLRLAPPEPLGPVRLGAALLWDVAGGARERTGSNPKRYDRVYWSETTLAAGLSASPLEFLKVYGGVSYVSFRARFSVGTVKTDWKQDSPWGGFGGVSLVSGGVWFLNAEARAGGETALGAFLGYKY